MTAAPIRTRRHPGLIGVAAAAGGLALFVYFVARAGVDEVVAGIVRIGWAFVIVVALAGLRFVARALAWLRCMPAGHGFRLRDIMPAVLAGDALGNLTPLSLALGEPVKALYLRDRAPLGRTMPALAVETLFYTLSIVVVVAAGGVTLFVLVRPPAADSLITAVPLVTLAVLVTGLHWLMWKPDPVGERTCFARWRASASRPPCWNVRRLVCSTSSCGCIATIRETGRASWSWPRFISASTCSPSSRSSWCCRSSATARRR